MKKDENFEKHKHHKEHCECDCEENCECGCQDGHECTCDGDCHCEHEHCHCEEPECECDDCHHDEAGEYLAMAQRLQADFDNYRRRVAEQLDYQREEGKRSVIEVFLPCLDTFKEAKKTITDESVLAGVQMIENKILNALASLNVTKIETIGQKYDHNLHEVIAVMHDDSKEDDENIRKYVQEIVPTYAPGTNG